jgi:hypothetical protein
MELPTSVPSQEFAIFCLEVIFNKTARKSKEKLPPEKWYSQLHKINK